jgi:hypothetical protein
VNATIGIFVALSSIWNSVNRIVSQFINYLTDVVAKFLGIDTSAKASQKSLQGIGNFLGVLGGIISTFISEYLANLVAQFNSLVGLLQLAAEWLQKVADLLASIDVAKIIKPGSPSPLEISLTGINGQLAAMHDLLPSSLGKLGGISAPNLGLAAAYTGGATRGFQFANAGVSNNNSRSVNFYGPVTVRAHDYSDFKRQLFEGVSIEERFGEG